MGLHFIGASGRRCAEAGSRGRVVPNVRYGLRVILKRALGAGALCPYCGSDAGRRIGSKYRIVWLLRCEQCGLMYRFPKDDVKESEEYYQSEYSKAHFWDFRLSPPTEEQLAELEGNLSAVKDFSKHIQLIGSIKPQGRLLDFGCSWGYGTYQFIRAGYDGVGYEISRSRAQYGATRLGVRIVSSLQALEMWSGLFDVLFAHHVLEHMPDISSVFHRFRSLLAPGGLLAVFVPDCTGCEHAEIFHRKKHFAFGEAHTIAFDVGFFQRHLPNEGFEVLQCGPGFGVDELMVLALKGR